MARRDYIVYANCPDDGSTNHSRDITVARWGAVEGDRGNDLISRNAEQHRPYAKGPYNTKARSFMSRINQEQIGRWLECASPLALRFLTWLELREIHGAHTRCRMADNIGWKNKPWICIGMRRFWEREIAAIRSVESVRRSDFHVAARWFQRGLQSDARGHNRAYARVKGCDLHKMLAVSLATPHSWLRFAARARPSLTFIKDFLPSSRMKNPPSRALEIPIPN